MLTKLAARMAFCALVAPFAHLGAQCMPPRNSNEARLLALYSLPVIFAADEMAIDSRPGELRLSAEGALVPQPSAALQHTNYCYAGKAENTTLTRFFGRPRLSLELPGGFGIEASYLPAVTVASATPRLGSGAMWFTRRFAPDFAVTLRAHATYGTITGPITCPVSSLQQTDSNSPCYGTSASSDHFQPNDYGAELIGSRPINSAIRASASIGVNELRPRFEVGFSDLLGGTDHTRIAVNLTRVVASAGLSARLGSRCGINGSAYSSFGDAVTVRAIAGCALLR